MPAAAGKCFPTTALLTVPPFEAAPVPDATPEGGNPGDNVRSCDKAVAVAVVLLLTSAATATALPECLPDCAGANLQSANLEGADLRGANLVRANLQQRPRA